MRTSLINTSGSSIHATLVSEAMDGALAYQWWISHSLARGLDKHLSLNLPHAKFLGILQKWQVNDKTFCKDGSG